MAKDSGRNRRKTKIPKFKVVPPTRVAPPPESAEGSAVKTYSIHYSDSGGIKKQRLENKTVLVPDLKVSLHVGEAGLDVELDPDSLSHDTMPPSTDTAKRARTDQRAQVRSHHSKCSDGVDLRHTNRTKS